MRKHEYIMAFLILLSILVSAFAYQRLPEEMASHWDSEGLVDGHISKEWGALLMPIVMIGLAFLFAIIPSIDPLGAGTGRFRERYDSFVLLLTIFMLLIHVNMILWGIGIMISPSLVVPIGLGALFMGTGSLLESSERNWFVGIRTPWTMMSDEVWSRTNKLGGKLFRLCGAIAMAGVFFPAHMIYLVLGPVLIASGFLMAYSYMEFRKEMGRVVMKEQETVGAPDRTARKRAGKGRRKAR